MSERDVTSNKRGMTPYRVTLTAGIEKSFDVDGDFFHVLTAPVADLNVRFDDGAPTPVFEGVGMRAYFKRFTLISATGQAVIVYAGFGHVTDGRASANVNVTASVEPGNTIDDGGDVACGANAATQLLAADADRLYATISNPSSNSITLRIGTSGVDGTKGTPLEPGMSLPIATTAAIYAFNPSLTTAQTLSASSVKQV